MNGTPTVLGILIVDDNATWAHEVRRLIERRLPESNRKVRWEATIVAGLSALKEFHADYVWLDLDLPDSRPPETPNRIREFPEPVFIFSDHFDKSNPTANELAGNCLKAGARRVYTKDADTVEWLVGELAQEQFIRAHQTKKEQADSPHAVIH